jgi:IPT/TIG domain
MNARLLAGLAIVLLPGCGGGGSPSAPGGGTGGTLILSGVVYGVDATGRRPLSGAKVEITESEAAWGALGSPLTDVSGRYVLGSLPARHYLARATRAGYDGSPVLNIGYLETSKTLDFELITTGLTTGPVTVSALDPATGSTGGGTTVKITGTGFFSGTTVTFDAERMTAGVESSTVMYATTPAHSAGTVNVIVSRPSGDSVTLSGGFTYAPPQSFNFNGSWTGYALAHPSSQGRARPLHSDMDMQLTIQNNVLTKFTCGESPIVLPAPPPAVSNGEFSLSADGVAVTGRIVSANAATGTINTVACPATRWYATRQ